jgi:hypothetical protein
MRQNIVVVEDGEDLSVIVRLKPSAFDPGGEIPGIAQVYRVVASAYGLILELVPLSLEPHRLSNSPKRILDKQAALE